MNERFHLDLKWPTTTQAPEGMPRRPWSVAEIEAMVAAGIIDEKERFELIGGEAVPMSPKGARHEMVKIDLNRHLQKSVSEDLSVAPETTLRLDDQSFVEPDFCVFPRAIAPGDMRGYDVLLAIEIADTSLHYDLGRKIGVYAAYGIPEIWVIDANTLVTHVHRRLGAQGYREIFAAGFGDTLEGGACVLRHNVPGAARLDAGLRTLQLFLNETDDHQRHDGRPRPVRDHGSRQPLRA